jgi:hypothetical protein
LSKGYIHCPSPWPKLSAERPNDRRVAFRAGYRGSELHPDYQETRPDGSRFDLHGVFTVDPAAEEILWFAFDSYGYPPLAPSRGAWEANRLVFTKTTPRGVGRSVFDLDGDRLIHTASAKLDGQDIFQRVAIGRFQRQSG